SPHSAAPGRRTPAPGRASPWCRTRRNSKRWHTQAMAAPGYRLPVGFCPPVVMLVDPADPLHEGAGKGPAEPPGAPGLDRSHRLDEIVEQQRGEPVGARLVHHEVYIPRRDVEPTHGQSRAPHQPPGDVMRVHEAESVV